MACYTKNEAKDLWDYAKETYLKQPGQHGYMDFKELTNKLSEDIFNATGGNKKGPDGKPIGNRIVPEEIARLLSTPKTVKTATKNLLMTDRNRAQALRQARAFVTGQETSPLARFIGKAYQFPYAGKTVAHSAALHMTHAWPLAFDPKAWRNFGKTWVDSWKAMKESNAQAIKENIMLDAKFDQKVKSGLAIDPREIYDDVQHRTGFWGKLGRMTANSFLGLKELRSMEWDRIWDTVPDHLKTEEMEKAISLHVNHMTGAPGPEGARVLSGKAGRVARIFAFAPSLETARVMRPVDFIKSAGVRGTSALNRAPVIGEQLQKLWGRSSPEAQFMARQNMKQWTRIAAVYSGILYSSHLLLKHFYGSDEDVNTKDPFKSDWLTPKGPDGSVLQATGGQIPMIRTAARIGMKPKQAGDALGNYLMGKLNPALSIPLELAKGKGFGGTEVPAPFGTQESTVGSWAEFLTAELGPIATEEGIHEFAKQMRDQNGIQEEGWNENILRAFYKAGLVSIPAIAGTHYYKPTPPKVKVEE